MFLEDDGPQSGSNNHDRDIAGREWSALAERFTNDGYREGITAGKEAASQPGFDEGFATVGAPLGRQLGSLRGMANGMLAYLTALLPQQQAAARDFVDLLSAVEETREIARGLDELQLRDIAPPDLDAVTHARQHDVEDGDVSSSDLAATHLASAFESLTTVDGAERMQELSARLQNVLGRMNIRLIAGLGCQR